MRWVGPVVCHCIVQCDPREGGTLSHKVSYEKEIEEECNNITLMNLSKHFANNNEAKASDNVATSTTAGNIIDILSSSKLNPEKEKATNRKISANLTYTVTKANPNTPKGTLVDRGANGVVLGAGAMILDYTGERVDVEGFGNSTIANIPTGTGATYALSKEGPIILVWGQAALVETGNTVLSSIQMEAEGHEVNDKSLQAKGGKQCIMTATGHTLPLYIYKGLPQIAMRECTYEEWETLPHVTMTSEEPWDPTQFDSEDWYHPVPDNSPCLQADDDSTEDEESQESTSKKRLKVGHSTASLTGTSPDMPMSIEMPKANPSTDAFKTSSEFFSLVQRANIKPPPGLGSTQYGVNTATSKMRPPIRKESSGHSSSSDDSSCRNMPPLLTVNKTQCRIPPGTNHSDRQMNNTMKLTSYAMAVLEVHDDDWSTVMKSVLRLMEEAPRHNCID